MGFPNWPFPFFFFLPYSFSSVLGKSPRFKIHICTWTLLSASTWCWSVQHHTQYICCEVKLRILNNLTSLLLISFRQNLTSAKLTWIKSPRAWQQNFRICRDIIKLQKELFLDPFKKTGMNQVKNYAHTCECNCNLCNCVRKPEKTWKRRATPFEWNSSKVKVFYKIIEHKSSRFSFFYKN